MKPRSVVLGGLFLAVLALTTSAQPAKTPEKVYATPQAVFAAAFAAHNKGDYKVFLGCFTAETQKEMASDSVLTALSMTRFAEEDKTGKFKEKIKPIVAVMAGHGLTEKALKEIKPAASRQDQEKALFALLKDPIAFAADFMTSMEKVGFSKRDKDVPDPALTDVKINGDKAAGSVVIKMGDKERKRPMAFIKVGGGWKVVIPEAKPAPKEEAAPKDKAKTKAG